MARALLFIALMGVARPSAARPGFAPLDTSAAAATSSAADPTSHLTRLPLCDCGPAPSSGGLACPREGDVIVGFEKEGQWLAGGGGVVPLSRAICCRVCMPEGGDGGGRLERPDDPPPPPPSAIISANCRQAADDGGGSDPLLMTCDARTGGFVTAFTASSPVPALGSGVSFPLGPPLCCTPAALLPGGSLIDAQACDCLPAPRGSVSCGNGSDGRAIRGFAGSRTSLGGWSVPAGPAACCRACVDFGEPAGPASLPYDCAAHGCSGRGACLRGGCVCEPGWSGPACAARADPGGSGLLDLLEVVLAVAGAVALLTAGAACGRGVAAAARELMLGGDSEAGGGERGEMDEPLLVRLAGGPGSVGSVDTDSDDGGGGEGGGGEGGGGGLESVAEEDEDGEGEGEEPPAAAAAGDVEAPAPATTAPGTPKDEADAGPDPLPAAIGVCAVCVDRPIQVVAVPCGHAALCRRCARRLATCPVCRAELVRRQRLFVGG